VQAQTPTGQQPVNRPQPRRSGARWVLITFFVAVGVVALGAFQAGLRHGGEVAAPAPTSTARAGVSGAAVATAKPAPPPARLAGILVMMNVGPGEEQGQANRVYLRGVDTEPGPKLRIALAPFQAIDVDPRKNVRRIAQVPVRQILDHPSRSWHPAPELVVRLGERVKVIVQNRDKIEHTFTFEDAEVSEDVFKRKTKTVEFTVPSKPAPKNDPFQYYCRFRQLGMDGPFVVRA
jgi:hypothetical protein